MPIMWSADQTAQVSAYYRMEMRQLPRVQGICQGLETQKDEIRSRLEQENKKEITLETVASFLVQ